MEIFVSSVNLAVINGIEELKSSYMSIQLWCQGLLAESLLAFPREAIANFAVP